MLKRFKEMAVSSTGLSVLGGVLLAASNGPFVQVWLHGKMGWPPVNDLLLGLWLVVGTTARMHILLAGATKRFGFLRYVYTVEGMAFVGLNILLYRFAGITLMLALSIVCLSMCSLPYALRRTHRYCDVDWRSLAGWYRPTWELAWRFLPVVAAAWWLARALPPIWQLILTAAVAGPWGLIVFLRYGLSRALQSELASKMPSRLRPVFNVLLPLEARGA